MRKMVIHFGPDGEGAGALKNQLRDSDPATNIRSMKTVKKEEPVMSWRGIALRKLAGKIIGADGVISGVALGAAVLKKVKEMPRKKKMIAGALVVAGIAGAAYLRSRGKRR